METVLHIQPSVCAIVPDDERLGFLPQLFGRHGFILGQNLVCMFMADFCADYKGGYWDFYTVSNGARFMAPKTSEPVALAIPSNYFEGDLSAQACGIVLTLFSLSHLSMTVKDESARQLCCEQYHALIGYASERDDAAIIFSAID